MPEIYFCVQGKSDKHRRITYNITDERAERYRLLLSKLEPNKGTVEIVTLYAKWLDQKPIAWKGLNPFLKLTYATTYSLW